MDGADEARYEDGGDDNEDGEAGDALRPEVAHRSVAVPAISSGNSLMRTFHVVGVEVMGRDGIQFLNNRIAGVKQVKDPCTYKPFFLTG